MFVLSVRSRLSSLSSRFLSTAPPSVSSSAVNITFIDHSGARVTVPGLVGSTVYDVAATHKIDLGPASKGAIVEAVHNERWTEDLYGEGVTTAFDHIKIPRVYQGIVGRMTKQEEMMLDQYWDEEEISPEASRLASMVKVTKEMDGMSIYIPDGLPDDCP
ncbi:hypothetical protein TrCOL_g11220 [Triparma columacea]|uniref:Uncharacterized protein n=1 Tax=Triparma columacea TaxID=722753 RepID=A0A9W7LF69_9STRA|nr:hypothetical protein TrCOL_g11220 [Triparma columacea]